MEDYVEAHTQRNLYTGRDHSAHCDHANQNGLQNNSIESYRAERGSSALPAHAKQYGPSTLVPPARVWPVSL